MRSITDTMASYLLSQDQLNPWLLRVKQNRRLFTPLPDADGVVDWREVEDPEQIALEPGVPDMPLKKLFTPLSEVLLRYGYRGDRAGVVPTPPVSEPFAVFGVRPCDAYALAIADTVYLSDVPDPYYQARRDAGTIIAVNCTSALPECFCACLNDVLLTAPGADILLTQLNGDYLVETLTDKGKALLVATVGQTSRLSESEETGETPVLTGWKEASEADLERKAEIAAQTAAAQTRKIDVEGLTEAVRAAYHDEEFWKAHTEACVGCGVCTFLCPTCTYFDVRDDAISGRGLRYRCWDTCQFADFSREASGHDPKSQQWMRQRNRLSHKFWYSVERGGPISCVGCGRCLRGCAGHTDIVATLEDLRKKPIGSRDG